MTGESRLTGLNFSFGGSGFKLFDRECDIEGVRCSDEKDPDCALGDGRVEVVLMFEGERTKEGGEAIVLRSGALLPIVATSEGTGLGSRSTVGGAVPMPSASSPSRSKEGAFTAGADVLTALLLDDARCNEGAARLDAAASASRPGEVDPSQSASEGNLLIDSASSSFGLAAMSF